MWLKSGGYIVINQTEALVAIDVNTGKYVGKSNRLEDTIVKTNTEAVKEIVRQIRLRDLGGIIVVDFIDMDERKNRQKVMQALEDAMRADRAPYKILQFNDFGLVAITRKRVKQSLERTLCTPCPHCEGAGYVKSVQTVVSEILPEAQQNRASAGRQGRDAARPSGRREGSEVAPEPIPGGAGRNPAPARAGEERPAAASREIRSGLRRLSAQGRQSSIDPDVRLGRLPKSRLRAGIRWANPIGEMAEWLKAHAWKACIGETLSRVRIPLSPP